MPHIGDVIMQGAEHIQAFDSPVMMVRRRTLSLEYRAVKRGFDLIASAAALILLSPVFCHLLQPQSSSMTEVGWIPKGKVRLKKQQ